MSSRQVSKLQSIILLCRNRSCAGLSDICRHVLHTPVVDGILWYSRFRERASCTAASSQDTSLRCSVRCGPTGHQALYCWGHRAPSARLVHCSSIQSLLHRGLHQVRSPQSQHHALQMLQMIFLCSPAGQAQAQRMQSGTS